MEIILLIFTLIALFCCTCSFFIGIDLGRELQRKEDENQNKILKEIEIRRKEEKEKLKVKIAEERKKINTKYDELIKTD